MRNKLKGQDGLTLVELLAATAILVLLVLLVNIGMTMAIDNYRRVVAQSELDMLVSNAVDTLADELRFARNVEATDGDISTTTDIVNFTYDSSALGKNVKLIASPSGSIAAKRAIYVDDAELMSTGVRGQSKVGLVAYELDATASSIEYEFDDDSDDYGTFKINLTMKTTDDSNIALTSKAENVTVKCLNP